MSNSEKKVVVVITAYNHKHAGQPVPKGARIETDETTAKWLVNAKVGVFADAAKKETK